MWDINGSTRLAAVVGHPLDHSLSPVMHNAAYEVMGLNWVYVPMPAPDEGAVARVAGLARALPMVGFNVTMPWKQLAFELCDEVALTARMAGAVNTVQVVDGRLVGYNTDARGVLEALRSEAGMDVEGAHVTVLGAGGAAGGAVVAAVLGKAASISVVNRNLERAEELIERVSPHVHGADMRALPWDQAEGAIKSSAAIINSTPIGMGSDDPSPVPGWWFTEGQVVMDMVYRAEATALVNEARAAGAVAFDGLPMLVAQGAIAIDIWDERARSTAPRDVMRAAAEAQLESRRKVGEGS